MDDTKPQNKFFRAEKTDRANDDRKVMITGVLLAIMILLGFPYVDQIHDQYIKDRPFISAVVEIKKVEGKDDIFVLYDADATQDVKGLWVATIYMIDEQGVKTRIGSRRGNGSYIHREDEPRLWTWDAFFDTEKGIDSPPIPIEPFQICVRYDVYTSDSNTHDKTLNFCSQTFYP